MTLRSPARLPPRCPSKPRACVSRKTSTRQAEGTGHPAFQLGAGVPPSPPGEGPGVRVRGRGGSRPVGRCACPPLTPTPLPGGEGLGLDLRRHAALECRDESPDSGRCQAETVGLRLNSCRARAVDGPARSQDLTIMGLQTPTHIRDGQLPMRSDIPRFTTPPNRRRVVATFSGKYKTPITAVAITVGGRPSRRKHQDHALSPNRSNIAMKQGGRVKGWRAYIRVRWRFRCFRSGPKSGSHRHVSSPCSPNPACRFPEPGSPVGSCASHTDHRIDSGMQMIGLPDINGRGCTASALHARHISGEPSSLFMPRQHRACTVRLLRKCRIS